MISVEAAAIFLYWCERVFRTFCSISFMKFTFLCYFTKRTDTMSRCKVSECEFSRKSDSFVLLNTGTPTRAIHVRQKPCTHGLAVANIVFAPPCSSTLFKKMSTLYDKHHRHGIHPLRQFMTLPGNYIAALITSDMLYMPAGLPARNLAACTAPLPKTALE